MTHDRRIGAALVALVVTYCSLVRNVPVDSRGVARSGGRLIKQLPPGRTLVWPNIAVETFKDAIDVDSQVLRPPN